MYSCTYHVSFVVGTLADHNYALHHTYHIQAYISCCTYPPQATIKDYWEDNRAALVNVLKFARDGKLL